MSRYGRGEPNEPGGKHRGRPIGIGVVCQSHDGGSQHTQSFGDRRRRAQVRLTKRLHGESRLSGGASLLRRRHAYIRGGFRRLRLIRRLRLGSLVASRVRGRAVASHRHAPRVHDQRAGRRGYAFRVHRARTPRSDGRPANGSSLPSPERVALCAVTRASRPRPRRRWRASRRRASTAPSRHPSRRAGGLDEAPPRGPTARRTTSTPTRRGSAPPKSSRSARRARAPRRRRKSPSPSPRVSRVLPCRAPRAVANAGTPSAASPRRECARRASRHPREVAPRYPTSARTRSRTFFFSCHGDSRGRRFDPGPFFRRQKSQKKSETDTCQAPTVRLENKQTVFGVSRDPRPRRERRGAWTSEKSRPGAISRDRENLGRDVNVSLSSAPRRLVTGGFPEASPRLAHTTPRATPPAPPPRRRAPRVTQGWRDGPFRRARATVRLEPDPGPIRARRSAQISNARPRTWRDRHRAPMPRGGPTLTARPSPHPDPRALGPTGTSRSTSRATPCP